MKKIKLVHRMSLIIYLLMILCILSCIFNVIKLFPYSIQEMYEKIWGIKLPENFELVYDTHTPASFHGDGERYTIFKAPEDFKVQENRNLQGIYQKKAEQEEFALEILEVLNISKEERPNFNKKYTWRIYKKNSNKLLIMYFFDNNYFYFFQHLQ